MKLGLVLNAINPRLGGVLIRGEKGTAKSTAVRALAALLPEIEVVEDCPYSCDPHDYSSMCSTCRQRVDSGEVLPRATRRMRVVDLPVSVTEDRVVGTLNLEEAIKKGEKRFEPGLLATANRGILYVDEVNLLDDHIVDILLDSAAMGVNTVEREGISFTHPANFILVGTMNPEEGELRPQLLDRFGLMVQVEGMADPVMRMEVVKRRLSFDDDPDGFYAQWEEEEHRVADQILKARSLVPHVPISESLMYAIARIAIELGVDGHRADIVMVKAAKTLAALQGKDEATIEDVRTVAELVLPHRLRRRPFEDASFDFSRLDELLRVNV